MNTAFQTRQHNQLSVNQTAWTSRGDVSETIELAKTAGYPIPKNPDLVVNKTLRTHGLMRYNSMSPEPVGFINTILAGGKNQIPIFSYGAFAFVVSPNGSIGFAKLRYGPKNIWKVVSNGRLIDAHVGGLHREAKVLKELSKHGYHVPKVFGYYPAKLSNLERHKANTFETLVIEAVIPPEGAIMSAKKWTPALSRLAAKKIKTFTAPVSEVPVCQSEKKNIPFEMLVQLSKLSGKGTYDLSLKTIISQYKHFENQIIIHGDAWPDNIGIKRDSDLLFLDWELAGPGYRGQDAGRTLWGLTLGRSWNKSWRLIDINQNSIAFIDEWCQSEDDRNTLKFGVMLESLRMIADRQILLESNTLSTRARLHLQAEIDDVKWHALIILDYI